MSNVFIITVIQHAGCYAVASFHDFWFRVSINFLRKTVGNRSHLGDECNECSCEVGKDNVLSKPVIDSVLLQTGILMVNLVG